MDVVVVFCRVRFLKENEKEIEEDGDYGDVKGWSSGDGSGFVMVRVKMVVMERKI